ncbi:hypothetical protein ACOMHN_003632 [Nucella lapillus]
MDATTDLHVSSNGSGAPEISQGLNLVGKLQRFISHKDFLLECLKKNITPRVVSRVTAQAPRLPKQRNISRKSQEALQQLRDLVQKRILRISPADKGGAVVVQSFSQYHEEAKTEHYRTSQEDTSQDIAKQSNEFVHNLHGQEIIDDKCREWAKIKENDVKTPTFYHLPKVHKDN